MINCCYNCKDRVPLDENERSCHSYCERYKAQVEEAKKMRENKDKALRAEREYLGFMRTSAVRRHRA